LIVVQIQGENDFGFSTIEMAFHDKKTSRITLSGMPSEDEENYEKILKKLHSIRNHMVTYVLVKLNEDGPETFIFTGFRAGNIKIKEAEFYE